MTGVWTHDPPDSRLASWPLSITPPMWSSSGVDPGGCTPPLKLEKLWFFWRKIVIFHTKHPKIFRTSLHSAQFFLSSPPLTWNPGSAPAHNILYMEQTLITIFIKFINILNTSTLYIVLIKMYTIFVFTKMHHIQFINFKNRHQIKQNFLSNLLCTVLFWNNLHQVPSNSKTKYSSIDEGITRN